MRAFDDFDAWGDAISSANLRLACDAFETRRWTLGMVDLGAVSLQFAFEGGGNICYGANAHVGPLLFLPLTHAAAHFANGRSLDEESLFLIPRGADFRIHVRKRAHEWCSIALPGDVALPNGQVSASDVVSCASGAVPRLKRLAQDITRWLLDRPAGSAAHQAASRDLLAAATACLPRVSPPGVAVGRPRLDRAEIVRRAMAVIEANATAPLAADLARDVGVTGRTLLRAFREEFGVCPKRFLMVRELHAVRRSLRAATDDDDTVADILVRHGVWEFGRFAARYRHHFGELPSQTLAYATRG